MKRSCCFKEPFTREQVDPRVKAKWEAAYGKRAPFGNLRAMWVREHCQILAPYDDADCPYDKVDCALSFLTAVEVVTEVKRVSPTGYFRSVARTLAFGRAEDKPLARQRDTGAGQQRDEAGPLGVRRAPRGPERLGDLLRSLDVGPREGRAPDGRQGPER